MGGLAEIAVVDCGELGLKFRLEIEGLEPPVVILTITWFPDPCVWPGRIDGAKGMLEVFGQQALVSWAAAKFFRRPEAIKFEGLRQTELALSRLLQRPPEGHRWEGIGWDMPGADGPDGFWHLQAVQAVPLQRSFVGRELLGALCRFFAGYNGKRH